ncbi:MAG: hypothetical protein LUE89_09675 [Clostridiales bacterium]|nr:hypothetical protein [Clostridiales bacterium]
MTGKVTIIGSGGVGSAIGYALNFIPSVNMIVFVDLNIRAADGEALDIGHGIGALSTASVRAGDYEDCRNSDVIIITAGFSRQVGQTRDDLLERNQKVMDSVLAQLRPFYTDSFVIVVSNPVDYLTGYVSRQGFIPAEKLCGTGCMLDTSRWISELAKYLNVKCSRVHAYSVGKHGSGQRLLWPLVTVDGQPIDDFCREQGISWNSDIKAWLEDKVTEMGADIIAKKGRTQYGIATVAAYLVQLLLGEDMTLVSVTHTLRPFSGPEPLSDLAYLGDGHIALAEDEERFLSTVTE